jgi:hypothetical protein
MRTSSLSPNLLLVGLLALAAPGAAQYDKTSAPRPPVRVKIEDDKPVVIESALPLDDKRKHMQITHGPNLFIRLRVDNKTMHLGYISTALNVDGRALSVGPPGRMEAANRELPRGPGGKVRDGRMSVFVVDDLRVTQTVEVVPTRPEVREPGAQRKLAGALVRYTIENRGKQPRKVALRVTMDAFWVNNDGCLHATPDRPGKPARVVDGVELSGKELPPYLKVLQVPNLKNPGEVAHFTYDLGSKLEPPTRVIVTRLGAFRDAWNMNPQPANGDSAMGMYWDPKVIPPGVKREIAYAYGQGIASSPEGEGKVGVVLGGSFEPGQRFDVMAYVEDPIAGQSLELDLPPGMQLVEGPRRQPVPPLVGEGNSLVLWRASVERPGTFALRVRSSNGVTYTKRITISRGDR